MAGRSLFSVFFGKSTEPAPASLTKAEIVEEESSPTNATKE